MKDAAEHWNDVYAGSDVLPWDLDYLPNEIRGVVEPLPSGSRILDVGCGRGQHSVRIASYGHVVVGIDISQVAISYASVMANRLCEKVAFVCESVLDYHPDTPFDLAIDYSMFHHIAVRDHQNYAQSMAADVRRGGEFLVVCYSDQDPAMAANKVRIGSMGNTMTHLSREEVASVFKCDFELKSYQSTRLGSGRNHLAHSFVFRRM